MTARVRDTFPAACVLAPVAGGSYPFTGIFDEAAQTVEVDRQTGVQFSTTAPRVTMRLADLVIAPRARDTLAVGARAFEITESRPDGAGMTVLQLVEV